MPSLEGADTSCCRDRDRSPGPARLSRADAKLGQKTLRPGNECPRSRACLLTSRLLGQIGPGPRSLSFVQNVATAPRPAADIAMRRLLRIPDGPPAPEGAAQRAFSTSILVSATRCIITYVLLPFVVPVLGIAAGVGPWLGIPIGVAAIVCNVLTIRRFWAADHKWRWAYTALALTIIVLLLVLMAKDIASVLG